LQALEKKGERDLKCFTQRRGEGLDRSRPASSFRYSPRKGRQIRGKKRHHHDRSGGRKKGGSSAIERTEREEEKGRGLKEGVVWLAEHGGSPIQQEKKASFGSP